MWRLLQCCCTQKIEVRGLAGGFSTAAVRWRPTGVRGGLGASGAGQRGRATAAGKARVTRGEGKEEVDGGDLHGGGRGSGTGGGAEEAGENRAEQGRAHARGGRREGKGSEDLFVKTKNFRDPTEKKDFPLI
jgi:hypothetical protein